MEEIKRMEMALLRDRNVVKVRVNFIEGGRVWGFLRPVGSSF